MILDQTPDLGKGGYSVEIWRPVSRVKRTAASAKVIDGHRPGVFREHPETRVAGAEVVKGRGEGPDHFNPRRPQ